MLSDFVTDLKNNFCWKLRKNNCSSLSLVDARKGNYSEISCVKIVLRNFLLEISLREISGSGKAAFLWKGSVDKRVERGRNCCSFFDSLIVVAIPPSLPDGCCHFFLSDRLLVVFLLSMEGTDFGCCC